MEGTENTRDDLPESDRETNSESDSDSGEVTEETLKRMMETAPLTDDQIMDELASQMGMERVDLDAIEITPDLLRQIPKDFVLKRRVFPIGHNGTELKIAVHDPTDILVRDNLEKMLRKVVIAYLTSEEQIDSYIRRYY